MKGEFCLEINYTKGASNAENVFRASVALIESFIELDKILVSSIDSKIKPILILEDIEGGSIKIWFRTILSIASDDALRNLNWKPIVGQYMVKGKHKLLKMLEENDESLDRKRILKLRDDLSALAEETNVKSIPAYTPPPVSKLANSMVQITESLSFLEEGDSAAYVTDEGRVAFNPKFKISKETVEEVLTMKVIRSTIPMILKIKKPDYLGDSMWDFRYKGRSIQAKISDVKWLKDFQSRKVEALPGDAIFGTVDTEVKYGFDQEVVVEHYTITEVKEVMSGEQETLL